MMYISVFPIAISMRKTNVYEEKSLGIYSHEEEDNTENSYFGTHVRRQLSFDLWFVFLGFFIIAIVEGSRLQNVSQRPWRILRHQVQDKLKGFGVADSSHRTHPLHRYNKNPMPTSLSPVLPSPPLREGSH